MDLKISELLDGGAAQSGDQIAIARAGGSYELTLAEVQTFVLGTLQSEVNANTTAVAALPTTYLALDGSNDAQISDNLTMPAGYRWRQTEDPAVDQDVVTLGYLNANFLNLVGGTLTGALILHAHPGPGDPALQAATKQYVDDRTMSSVGTVPFIPRFDSSSTSLANSKFQDDGTTTSLNGVVDGNSQLHIYTALGHGLKITSTGTSGIIEGIDVELNTNTTSEVRGEYIRTTNIGSGLTKGIDVLAINTGTGNATGVLAGAYVDSSASIVKGSQSFVTVNSGTTTSAYSMYLSGVGGSGVATTVYHMYLAAHSIGNTKWGIYQAGVNDLNKFRANIAVGEDDPTATDYITIGGSTTATQTEGISGNMKSTTGSVRGSIFINTTTSGAAYGHSIQLFGNTVYGFTMADSTVFASGTSAHGFKVGNITMVGSSLTLDKSYSFHAEGAVAAGTNEITNAYHIYLEAHSLAAGTPWGIYQAGPNDSNYFAGDIYIGANSGTTKFRLVDTTEGSNKYLKSIDINGNANWATIQASEVNGISGTTNQIAYFSGTDIISGDSDFLFNGTNVALGDTIDSNRRLKVTNTNALTGIWASSTRVGASNIGILGTSTGANTGTHDNKGVRGYANSATGTANNIGGQFDYGATLVLPDSSDYAISAYADGTSGRDQYGIYLKSAKTNSSTNYGIYLNIGNAGAGEAFGIYETGGGFKNTVVRNVFESLTTIGLDKSAWLTTNTMFAMEGGNNDVSDTLTGYAGGSTGNYTGGYDEYNITRLVKGSSGYSPFAVLSGRGDTNDDEDFGFITITNGDSLSAHNPSGLIAVQMNGSFNHLTDMIFAVRGNGNSNPSTASDTRGHYQEAIRIIGGTSGSYVGNDTDNKIDTSTVTPPTVRFGGSKGYEFPAEDGSANYYLKTDGSGNLYWSAT